MSERSELDDDLRATSDAILDEARQVRLLEDAKRALSPSSPAVGDLSRRVEEVAVELLHNARIERSLAQRRTAAEDAAN
jgi:hypothetical protein